VTTLAEGDCESLATKRRGHVVLVAIVGGLLLPALAAAADCSPRLRLGELDLGRHGATLEVAVTPPAGGLELRLEPPADSGFDPTGLRFLVQLRPAGRARLVHSERLDVDELERRDHDLVLDLGRRLARPLPLDRATVIRVKVRHAAAAGTQATVVLCGVEGGSDQR
jgi:hypothetical protein